MEKISFLSCGKAQMAYCEENDYVLLLMPGQKMDSSLSSSAGEEKTRKKKSFQRCSNDST